MRGPLCEGWPVHDLIVEPGSGAILAGRRQPVVRPGGLAQRGRRRDLDPLVGRHDLRRRGRADQDRLEPGDDPGRRAPRRRRAGRALPQRRRRRDLGARRGPDQPPDPADLAARAPAASSSTRSSPTRPTRRGPGSGSPRSACSRRATAARRGSRATSASARSSSPDPFPITGQCVHKFAMAAGAARDALPAEPLRRLPLRRRRRDLEGDHRQRPADRVRVPDGRPPARPRHGLGHPAQRRRPGPLHARRASRRSGGRTTAARRGSAPTTGCRRATRTSRSCARRWPATRSTRSGSRSGRRPASSGTARTRAGRGG